MNEEQKDLIISKLEKENFELRKFEKAYYVLNKKLTDLENSFDDMQNENYQKEVSNVNILADKEYMVKSLNDELSKSSEELYRKDLLLDEIKNEEAKLKMKNIQIYKEKAQMENDLTNIGKQRYMIKEELSNLINIKNKLYQEYKYTEIHTKDIEKERDILIEKLKSEETKLALINEKFYNRQRNIEINELMESNRKLNDDNIRLSDMIRNMEQQLYIIQKTYDEKYFLYNNAQNKTNVERQLVPDAYNSYEDKIIDINKNKYTSEKDTTLSFDLYREKTNIIKDDVMKSDYNSEQEQNLNTARKETVRRSGSRENPKSSSKGKSNTKRLEAPESSKNSPLGNAENNKITKSKTKDDTKAKLLSAKKELERIKNAHTQLVESREKINKELDELKKHTEQLKNKNTIIYKELVDKTKEINTMNIENLNQEIDS